MANTGAMRVVSPSKTIDVMVMRIVTRFTTVDEFVAAFRKFCGEGTCFIPSAQAKRIGIETGFSIRLADGTPMLRGLCVVLDSWATDENPYHRPGVRLGIRSLTAESKPVFARLLLAGRRPTTEVDTKATVEMAPLFTQENRAPHADEILPANPLMEMSDESLGAFVDCMIFEDAIPEAIDSRDSGINDATGRIEDDRNDQTTRRIEVTERIVAECGPKAKSLELALAAAASGSMQLDGGTQRIERLESPIARASAFADEHADSAFGQVLAKAVERIQPATDHTVPTRMPSSMPRPTMLGIAPAPQVTPRTRVSMPAIADPAAPEALPTPLPPAPAAEPDPGTALVLSRPSAPGIWRRVTTRVRGWYRRLVWARRRRAALRG